MKVLYIFTCFFLSGLWVGNTDHLNAQVPFYTRVKGRDVTVRFHFSSPGSFWKFFCKEKCERENVVIETTEDRAQSSRYSISYEEAAAGGRAALSVSITQLETSDTGRYRCGLGRSSSSASLKEFEVIVIDALLNRHHHPAAAEPIHTTTGADLTVACFFTSLGRSSFFCKGKCREEEDIVTETVGLRATRGRYSVESRKGRSRGVIVYVSVTQLTETDSGRYRCGLDRTSTPDSYRDFDIIITDAPPSSKPDSTAPEKPTTLRPPSPPTQSLRSSSGSFTPSSAFTRTSTTSRTTEQPQTEILVRDVLLAVGLTLLGTVALSLAALIVCVKRKTKASGLRIRGNSDATNMEFPLYENQLPVSASEESTYQSLDPATRDQNQIYNTITRTKKVT